MTETDMIRIEVAYALPKKQKIISLNVPVGTSVYDAALQAGMEKYFPELDVATLPMGIFGKAVAKPQETEIQEGQRIELYRPLLVDPKEVRKQRAAKLKAEKAAQEKS